MWRAFSLVFLVFAAACSAPAVQPAVETGEVLAFGGGPGGAADACFTCHGLKGEGDDLSPRLAGQTHGYLVKQLEDYATRWRDHPQMSSIASRLDDAGRQAVAAYYASKQQAAPPLAASFAAGSKLFREGDPTRGIASCAECHGAEGMGKGLANPSLAGQPTAYLTRQLRAWRASDRRNDPQDMMGATARKLTDADIDVLAAYLSAAR